MGGAILDRYVDLAAEDNQEETTVPMGAPLLIRVSQLAACCISTPFRSKRSTYTWESPYALDPALESMFSWYSVLLECLLLRTDLCAIQICLAYFLDFFVVWMVIISSRFCSCVGVYLGVFVFGVKNLWLCFVEDFFSSSVYILV